MPKVALTDSASATICDQRVGADFTKVMLTTPSCGSYSSLGGFVAFSPYDFFKCRDSLFAREV